MGVCPWPVCATAECTALHPQLHAVITWHPLHPTLCCNEELKTNYPECNRLQNRANQGALGGFMLSPVHQSGAFPFPRLVQSLPLPPFIHLIPLTPFPGFLFLSFSLFLRESGRGLTHGPGSLIMSFGVNTISRLPLAQGSRAMCRN